MAEKVVEFLAPEASQEQRQGRDREFSPLRLSSARVYRRPSPSSAHQETDAEALARAVGRNIQIFRRRRGLTQQELGAAVGCDRSAVCRWEGGDRLPSLLHLVALGRALGYGVRVLLPEE